jgi:hypothetical protein
MERVEETDFRLSRLARLTWLALAALGVLDAVWIAVGGFRLVLAGVAVPALFVVLLAGGAAFLRRRRRNLPAVALLDGVAQLLACFALGAVLSYLVLSIDRPLIDGELAALDRMMGFDWPRYVAWVQARPALDEFLFKIYFSPTVQLMLVTIVLGAVDRRRLQELSTTMLVALLLTIAISGVFPGLDAYSHYASAHPELTNELGVHDLVPLRQGTLRELDLRRLAGLISFPSFHTVLALLFVYAVRGIRVLFPACAALNALVILATLTAGGHFLIDLFGGLAVTVAAIALARTIERRLRAAQPAAASPPPVDDAYPGLAQATGSS